jgi:polysaccharide export outer membrane protein
MSGIALKAISQARDFAVAATFSLILGGCASTALSPSIQSGSAAYSALQVTAQDASADYRIGPLDTIDVGVFQEPDLSVKGLEVDSSGSISMPLVGSLAAGGKTTTQLAADISQKLSEKYLKNPQVSVTVASSSSQNVTVEGQVAEPGVYPVKGHTSLLQTLALAKGETSVAALNQVVVFRTINGSRMGAVFDVKAIRTGRSPDPQILGNDVVVVGFSAARSLWKDILSTTPVLNLFRPIL